MEYSSLISFIKIILISVALGALIGIEREISQKHFKIRRFAGIRSFILISLFGTLSAYIASLTSIWFLILSFVCFMIFVISTYVVSSTVYKETGATTEIASMLTFIIGILTFMSFFEIAIISTILITILLSIKRNLHKFAGHIKDEEFYATIKFAVIAFVLLPLLPNKAYGPYEVFNPYLIWLMVVFISSISFAGYVLVKLIGEKKGITLTGFLGGLVSSTAVTMSFSQRSKKSKNENPLVLGTLVASATKFIRVLFVVSILNKALLNSLLWPLILMFITTIGLSLYFYYQKGKSISHSLDLESPFSIVPAIKFGAFFVAILYVSKISLQYFAEFGIYATSFFSGIADVDAITVTMSQLGGVDITLFVAALAIVISVVVNMVVKAVIGYLFGSRSYAKKYAIATALILITGLIPFAF